MTKKLTRQQKWRKTNPLRYAAHLHVENLKRLGLLVAQPCEVCGAGKADAHHDDYSRPGDVRWLCRRHHRLHHDKERRNGA